ncbi:prepilin-type N-terminal cleavage/methylation domain-containing protein [Anaerobacillus sp. CMMVII]|uniref:type II secretion system protein n=1 Tax=Anaerobacillus sp. CMMVII TaxID=2755588 RepID=UPI0021C4EBDE|nr:prepilin-type N-terminal cleavage/methylation domain-containing protein [Anaerobacillus sp. CMMVII]MCT8137490.1 prepilin-type N-terminal cleavage/methylation domain-containing protein [Anaerobacillus sp. CMMVII]
MFKALIQRLRKDQRGLTLIELLVVIVILGIIAAIAIPMVMGNQQTANANTNAQNRAILQDAVNRYKVINNVTTLPSTGIDLTADVDGGPYIEAIPTCAENATPFVVADTVIIPSGCLAP